jgi:AhpC/TSA family
VTGRPIADHAVISDCRSAALVSRDGSVAAARSEAARHRNRQVEVSMIPDLSPGNRFPDLELADHAGNQRRLSELTGGDPLILNFYRGWW